MTVTALLGKDEVTVARKGFTPDPSGSQYCVLDYTHDDMARIAARIFASISMERDHALSEALFHSLEGGEVGTVLLTYEIEPHLDVHPDARYVVLNYSRSYPARVAMRVYASKVEEANPELTARLRQAIHDSEEDFAEYVKSRIPKKKKRANAKKEKVKP